MRGTVPQKLNFASAGIGSVSHLNFEVFQGPHRHGGRAHSLQRGGGQAISDVVAGHVPMTISSVQATKGVVESGQVRALAVTGTTRSPAMPKRADHAGGRRAADGTWSCGFWFAIFGPKGLPGGGQRQARAGGSRP